MDNGIHTTIVGKDINVPMHEPSNSISYLVVLFIILILATFIFFKTKKNMWL